MAAPSLRLCAPAKLNLHLGIYEELDARRYHRADSLMVTLDLFDEVEVTLLDSGGIRVTCEPEVGVPPEKNTAYRAVTALAERVGETPNVEVHITKHIPDQAGMGGSSSDAASVIRALCELWNVALEDERVVEAARSVGADVPFFLDWRPQLLVGAGDVIAERFPALGRPVPVVLVRPSGPGVSTPAAYAEFDRLPQDPQDPSALCELLRKRDASPKELAHLLANNLDPVACRLLPAVGEVKSWLLAQDGVLGGQVTGSGSCVFGICPSDEVARRVASDAQRKFGGWTKSAHIQGEDVL